MLHDILLLGLLLTLKMEATCSSETSTDFQRTTQRYVPEDRTLNKKTSSQFSKSSKIVCSKSTECIVVRAKFVSFVSSRLGKRVDSRLDWVSKYYLRACVSVDKRGRIWRL
jgi:hypothetical protein